MSGYCNDCGNQHCICDDENVNGIDLIFSDLIKEEYKKLSLRKKIIFNIYYVFYKIKLWIELR